MPKPISHIKYHHKLTLQHDNGHACQLVATNNSVLLKTLKSILDGHYGSVNTIKIEKRKIN